MSPRPTPSTPLPESVRTALMITAARVKQNLPDVPNSNALPARRRQPYTIERFPAVNGAAHFVGYDGRGEVMLELRLPAHRVTEQTVERMRQWMMRNDELVSVVTPLSLV